VRYAFWQNPETESEEPMKVRSLATILILALGAGKMLAAKYPPETKNAALRYWMAFAEMQDTTADKATQELLEKTAGAEAPWDEARLGTILDANEDAIRMMQRATKLPECDWGLEYNRGPQASIAYAPRARALARLNTLEGMRQLAKGDSQAAVNTWLAGIRFSEDLARGGTLIFALMAKSVLLPDLRLLEQAARNGRLSEAEKKDVLGRVRAMREDAFDWASAWGMETATLEQMLQELRKASDPNAYYEALMSKPAPKEGLPPTTEDMQRFRGYMTAIESALREPPSKATGVLNGLGEKWSSLSEVEQRVTPDAQKVNAARVEIATARANMLRMVGGM
jgi:hypothetical protein